jgi:hypothetical protein
LYRRSRRLPRGRTEISDFRDDETLRVSNHLTPGCVHDRTPPEEYREIDRFEGGVGWLAHPDEPARRASHAFRDSDGEVWLFDPLDAPRITDLVEELGRVAGVVVLSEYHARDADTFADRYDVSVHVPTWFERTIAGFDVHNLRPLYAWHEAICFRESDGTLYVPDYLSTAGKSTVGDERIGMQTLSRLSGPSEWLGRIDPDRVLFGHGRGVFDGAATALGETLSGARRRFPRALLTAFPAELRASLGAIR